jgi:4-amino-4-deoxy-L-arabinose transferase-like glycosyltransferase
MFKLGKLLFDEAAGIFAAVLFGIGFWPILQQRALLGNGLVLTLLIASFYYLMKSFREDELNSFLIASVLTGLGLLTNKIFLFVVLLNICVIILFGLGKKQPSPKVKPYLRIAISLIVGIVVVLPLLFVVFANPVGWFGPLANQISTVNNPNSASKTVVFVSNLFSGLSMINWRGNSSWVDGIGNRAALDWVSGAFFLFGLSRLFFKDIKQKPKECLAILLAFLILLLPSTLSFANPGENPSLSRAIGVAMSAFLLVGRGFSSSLQMIGEGGSKSGKLMRGIFAGSFILLAVLSNFNLINNAYVDHYKNSAWNAKEMATVLQTYGVNNSQAVQGYVVGYPHWVDGRAVGIELGSQSLDLSILTDDLETTRNSGLSKVFLLHQDDRASLAKLQSLYPQGLNTHYYSRDAGNDFLIFTVN